MYVPASPACTVRRASARSSSGPRSVNAGSPSARPSVPDATALCRTTAVPIVANFRTAPVKTAPSASEREKSAARGILWNHSNPASGDEGKDGLRLSYEGGATGRNRPEKRSAAALPRTACARRRELLRGERWE